MKIIGIDPAPLKKNVLFDGEVFRSLSVEALKQYLDGIGEDVLICWDSPLNRGTNNGYGGFHTRRIERFLQSRITGIPKGIETSGYAECTQWTVSQYCLGYPIANEAYVKTDGYKFRLLESGACPLSGQYVVETQPGVSLWLLLRDRIRSVEWRYKGKKGNRELNQEIVNKLFRMPFFSGALKPVKQKLEEEYRLTYDPFPLNTQIMESGMLDAFVAWLTGFMYQEGSGKAKLLGDHRSGSILLAYDKDFFTAYDNYLVG